MRMVGNAGDVTMRIAGAHSLKAMASPDLSLFKIADVHSVVNQWLTPTSYRKRPWASEPPRSRRRPEPVQVVVSRLFLIFRQGIVLGASRRAAGFPPPG